MEVNFLNQKPCIPSWPGAFQFDILFSIVLSKSTCISIFGPSSSPSSSFVMLFIHSAFSLCFFGSHILAQNRSVSFESGCCMFSCHSLPIVDIISFRCFGMSYFVCTVLPFVDISIIFLLWTVFSGLFPQVVLLIFPIWPVPSSPLPLISAPLFIIRACFRSFFICDSSLISHPGFAISSCFLRGSQYSHKLISLLYILIHSTQLYYSLVCKVVCDLFYLFLSLVFPILYFLMKVE